MISPRHLGIVIAVYAAATPAAAVVLGQLDDFQDTTTQGWGSGVANPNPPLNVPDVGPAGVGDDSLQITSTSIPAAGGAFVAFNLTQWTGDFTAAGVDMITFDFNNTGAVSLNLRFAFNGAGGLFVTTVSLPVAAASGWQTLGLSITAADLTSVGGADASATLAAVSQLRLISAAVPAFQGDFIVAQGLVDNINAAEGPVQVPALSSWGLVAVGGAMLALTYLRRRGQAARFSV